MRPCEVRSLINALARAAAQLAAIGAELWGVTGKELQEIQRSLAEWGCLDHERHERETRKVRKAFETFVTFRGFRGPKPLP